MNALVNTKSAEAGARSASAVIFALEPLICDLDRLAGITETLFERAQEIGFLMLSSEHLEQLEHAISETRTAARAVRAEFYA